MKGILSSVFLLFGIISFAQPKDLYYQTVNSDKVADSIQEYLIGEDLEFVKFSQPGYGSRDTFFEVSYDDSHLFTFKDRDSVYKSLLVTKYFIFKEEWQYDMNKPYQFYRWNKADLVGTALRPDDRDRIKSTIDTAFAIEMGYDLNKSLSFEDSLMLLIISPGYEHYSRGKDGLPSQYITLFTKDTVREISIDQYLFFGSNYYYRFNCKMPIYTLRLLLVEEFEYMKEMVEFHLQEKELGLLDSLGRMDYNNNPEYFEKMYEEQVRSWIDKANSELGKKWKLKK